jgi:hypothetical protein
LTADRAGAELLSVRTATLALVLLVASLGPRAEIARAANVPAACTNPPSLTRPPETIRVLRTGSGLVEVVPFKLYVYRTHVAEFWSEYKATPYSDALLGVGAVAIKQNAWLWTRAGRDWWSASSTTSVQRAYVEADYADDGQLNGSTGDPAVARLTRATNHATWALRMRIRYGADRIDDGVGGLRWDPLTSTYTAPLAVLDESGAARPLSAETPRSCFDVTDHPSINQFYRPGGIYEPGATISTGGNARYNRAVDATWGLTVRRWYEATGDYRMWRPGFYGSFNASSGCLLPPDVGESGLVMRHTSQPSHWRGWSFFPVNAESCARARSLSTVELLRASFFSWDGTLVAGGSTSSIADDRYRIDWLRSIRLVSPALDPSGDGRADLLADSAGGVVRFVSADPQVDAAGRLDGIAPGALVLAPGERLLERLLARTEPDGSSAIVDLRRDAGGSASLLLTPFTGGVLGASQPLTGALPALDPTATLGLLAADTADDGVEELFLSERVADPLDPARSRLRLHRLSREGAPATLLLEASADADARAIVADLSGDGAADALVLSRDREGALVGSLALGVVGDWSLGALGAPGALLWPVAADYRVVVADALGDGGAELYVSYRDPAGIARIVRLALGGADPAAPLATPDLVFVPETEPPFFTRVAAGESRLAKITARTGVPLERLVALNAGGYRLERIRPNDTYAKIAARVGKSQGCLRTMNRNKTLYRYQTLKVPLDLCVAGGATVLYRGTPIRLRLPDTVPLLAGEGAEALAARLAPLGVTTDAPSLALLNPGLDLALAPAGTPVRIRAPWAPVARLAPAHPLVVAGSRTLGWSAPVELFRAASPTSPARTLLARDWTGDGVVDLLLVGTAGSGGSAIARLAYQAGRLVEVETIGAPFAVAGWTLR